MIFTEEIKKCRHGLEKSDFTFLEPYSKWTYQDHDDWLNKTYPEEKTRDALRLIFVIKQYHKAEELYHRRGWPISILEKTAEDISIWNRHHCKNFGFPGLQSRFKNWILEIYKGNVIRLGRLECNTNYHIECPILPSSETPAKLYQKKSLDSKRAVLVPGDAVINIHIPEDGPMTLSSCIDSFQRMEHFFQKYLPEYDYRGFYCSSWLLDPVLQTILPPTSNIIQFQKLGSIDSVSGESELLFRVFGNKGIPNKLPPNATSMQNAVFSYVSDGGIFHNGIMIILKKDFPALYSWTTQK